MSQPAVSIVTATRNRPAYLERALTSIGRQTHANYRVYVVDDGSSEENAEAYRHLVGQRDERFILLQPLRPGESGSGPAASRNRGINAGEEPLVAFLDDDDVWVADDHLEEACAALSTGTSEFFCSDMEAYRREAKVLDSWFFDLERHVRDEGERVTASTYRLAVAHFLRAAGGRVLHPNVVVVTRSLIRRAGGFRNHLWFGEDGEFLLRLLDHEAQVLVRPQVTARYRLPDADSSSTTLDPVASDLQLLSGAQHLGLSARSTEIRSEAARIESWTLRRLSESVMNSGRPGQAVALALEALGARPSWGASWHVLRQIARALAR
jgi:glycosyltransferase involved in cell wall biosynthesis